MQFIAAMGDYQILVTDVFSKRQAELTKFWTEETPALLHFTITRKITIFFFM